MNTAQAKEVLLRWRPGQSEDDPEVREALQLARADSELGEWFRAHASFQRAFRQQLRDIPVPSEFKEGLLAERKIVRPLWGRRRFFVAAAAASIALAGGAIFWASQASAFGNFRSRMVGFALREYRMDIVSQNSQEIREFLRNKGAPSDFPLPAGLAATPVKGGARLTWKGRPVAMVCFDWLGRDTLYLFVADQSSFQNSVPNTAVEPYKGLATSVWNQDGKVFLLAGPVDEAKLRELIAL